MESSYSLGTELMVEISMEKTATTGYKHEWRSAGRQIWVQGVHVSGRDSAKAFLARASASTSNDPRGRRAEIRKRLALTASTSILARVQGLPASQGVNVAMLFEYRRSSELQRSSVIVHPP